MSLAGPGMVAVDGHRRRLGLELIHVLPLSLDSSHRVVDLLVTEVSAAEWKVFEKGSGLGSVTVDHFVPELHRYLLSALSRVVEV